MTIKRRKLKVGDGHDLLAKQNELWALRHSKNYKGVYFSDIKDNGFGVCAIKQRNDELWGVMDYKCNIIVPFGKYSWIDYYDHGLARVNIVKQRNDTYSNMVDPTNFSQNNMIKWGIINRQGEEVLPIEFEHIWNFVEKKRMSTMVEKDGKAWEVYFSNLNPELLINNDFDLNKHMETIKYREEYNPIYYDEKIVTPYDNPYYNDALDMDQQSQEFWDSL